MHAPGGEPRDRIDARFAALKAGLFVKPQRTQIVGIDVERQPAGTEPLRFADQQRRKAGAEQRRRNDDLLQITTVEIEQEKAGDLARTVVSANGRAALRLDVFHAGDEPRAAGREIDLRHRHLPGGNPEVGERCEIVAARAEPVMRLVQDPLAYRLVRHGW